MKICNKCSADKPEGEFYIRQNGSLHSECKGCIRGRTRAYNLANYAKVRANGKAQAAAKRQRIRAATFAAYGGYVCACCGETERKFLTLDHVNNDGAAFRRSMYGNRNAAGVVTYAWLMRKGFPAGYQVLCMNCNHGKRMNNGVCPHKVRCNDHPQVGVGPSGPKHSAPVLKVVGAG